MSDAEGWPTWTTTVTRVTLLDRGLRVGARAAIEQPRIPRTVWTVTSLDEGHGFVWEVERAEAHAIARHRIEETGLRPVSGHAVRRAVGMDRLRQTALPTPHRALPPSRQPASRPAPRPARTLGFLRRAAYDIAVCRSLGSREPVPPWRQSQTAPLLALPTSLRYFARTPRVYFGSGWVMPPRGDARARRRRRGGRAGRWRRRGGPGRRRGRRRSGRRRWPGRRGRRRGRSCHRRSGRR